METTIAVPDSLTPNPAAVKGRAIGALIGGFFGSCWMLGAVYFGEITNPALLVALALLAAISVVWPIARLVRVRRLAYSINGGHRWADVSKPYWTIVVIEWGACIVVSNWLSQMGRADLISQAVGLIVGIHFVPLAKIFRAPIYHWTAAAMVLGVAASFAVPAGDLRNMVASGICGLALWATEAEILCQDGLASR
jgi:hypothetical protein